MLDSQGEVTNLFDDDDDDFEDRDINYHDDHNDKNSENKMMMVMMVMIMVNAMWIFIWGNSKTVFFKTTLYFLGAFLR